MTAYAVRGLDINTSYTIYRLLNKQKEKGVAVIYVGKTWMCCWSSAIEFSSYAPVRSAASWRPNRTKEQVG
jgi:hypothetical protein